MSDEVDAGSSRVALDASPAARISGTVTWNTEGGERVWGAVVHARQQGSAPILQVTDDDGDFTFERLKPGKWRLVALHEEAEPGMAWEATVAAGKSERVDLTLARFLGVHNEVKGRRFFWILVVALLILIVAYVALHFWPEPRLPGSDETPPAPRFAMWTEEPLWFVEVLFWALAGILAKKIFDVSYYVRRRRFYPEGAIMHVGHVVAVPLLVLVVIFLLSQVTLTLSIGESELQLDLDNPLLLAAVAFLLALNPWGLLSYLTGVGQRLIGEPEA